jgi:hypothetical protein
MPILVPTVKPSSSTALIETHFSKLRDSIAINNIDRFLIAIGLVTLYVIICGANTCAVAAEYNYIRYEWLKKFFTWPNDISFHDKFSRLFAHLNSEKLQSCFMQ